jgi:hypothetical protein
MSGVEEGGRGRRGGGGGGGAGGGGLRGTRKKEVDLTLNSNNPNLKGGELLWMAQ